MGVSYLACRRTIILSILALILLVDHKNFRVVGKELRGGFARLRAEILTRLRVRLVVGV